MINATGSTVQLVNQYVREIKNADSAFSRIGDVLRSIDQLSFVESGKPIPESEKLDITLRVFAQLFDDFREKGIAQKSIDNSNYLALVSYILQQLKASGK